jgi:hypothetical protein
METVIDRVALATDLERARADFHHVLSLVNNDEGPHCSNYVLRLMISSCAVSQHASPS